MYSVLSLSVISDFCDFAYSMKGETHMAVAGFLTRYMSGSLPYVRRHITVNKKCVKRVVK